MTLCETNAWPVDAFYENAEEAVNLVLREEPSADPDHVRALIMFEWLKYSYPAGRA